MRRIDYWIGITLCFFLTIVNSISPPFSSKKKKNNISKLLFIKLSEMGSIILAYPLINRIKREFPNTEIFFLTFQKNRLLIEILNILPNRNILTIREKRISTFIWDTLRVIREMRNERMDIVFDLEFFSRFTAILTYSSGAHKRIGFYRYSFEGLYRGNLLTHRVQYNPLLHISKSYLSLWQTLKVETKFTPQLNEGIEDSEISLPRFNLSEEAKIEVWGRLKNLGVNKEARILLLNPGEGNIPIREWPIENFISLTRMLLEDDKNYILIIGTEEASKKAELLYSQVNNRCFNLTGKTTLFEVIDLFNIAKVLISNDCGLAHIASLTPIKKFILFGPESPQVFSPLGENNYIIYSNLPCSPCLSAFNHRNSACRNNICLKLIMPDEIHKLINRYLD